MHTTARQAASTQTCFVAAQSITVGAESPSSPQRVTASPVAAQAIADGVHTHASQVAVAPWATHDRRVGQVVGAAQELPRASQLLTPPPVQRDVPSAQTWGRQVPPWQKCVEGQSAWTTHAA